MDRAYFQTQMNRLAETFGADKYKRERVELIWREVNQLGNDWFEKTVSSAIGDLATAPLLPWFRERASIERERLWALEKKQHREDARQFMCNPDYRDLAFGGIMKRLNGEMNDSAFEGFLGLLDGAATEIERGKRFEMQKQLEQMKREEERPDP